MRREKKSYIISFSFITLAAPKFIIRPTAQTVDAQGDASFECEAKGNSLNKLELFQIY